MTVGCNGLQTSIWQEGECVFTEEKFNGDDWRIAISVEPWVSEWMVTMVSECVNE